MGRLVHLLQSQDPDEQFEILNSAKKRFAEGGPRRLSYTFPPVIIQAFKLGKRFYAIKDKVRYFLWCKKPMI